MNKTRFEGIQYENNETRPVVYEQLLDHLSPSFDKHTNSKEQLHLTVASELMDHMIAGTEAQGWSLTYIFHQLSQHPEFQSALRGELLSLSPKLLYPSPSSARDQEYHHPNGNIKLPSFHDIDALPLLESIILETLRLYPAVPGSQPRITPTGSPASICGYHKFPSGVRISAQAYSLHRNEDIFPDPEAWRPRRWINTNKKERDEMMRWFWTFGSGGRMCSGNHLAMLGQ
jgi:cytochrome P450